jgi:hypothetical protein
MNHVPREVCFTAPGPAPEPSRKVNLGKQACWIFCLIGATSTLHAQILTFEGIGDNTTLGVYGGVTWQNAVVVSAGISLNELDFPPRSGVNVVVDEGVPINGSLYMSGALSIPAHEIGGYFTYTVPITLTAFDVHGAIVGTANSAGNANFATSGTGLDPNEQLKITIPGNVDSIASFSIAGDTLNGSSFVMDDFFTASQAVPEPSATTSSVLIGTSLIALFARRNVRRGAGPYRTVGSIRSRA